MGSQAARKKQLHTRARHQQPYHMNACQQLQHSPACLSSLTWASCLTGGPSKSELGLAADEEGNARGEVERGASAAGVTGSSSSCIGSILCVCG